MSSAPSGGDTPEERLILLVTGDAPRSRRARGNLSDALERAGLGARSVREVDLLEYPEETERYGIFATPALVRLEENARPAVLYGDLSQSAALDRFLADVRSGG